MAPRKARTSEATREAAPDAPVAVAAPAGPGALVRARLEAHLEGFHAVHLLAFGIETGAFQRLANAGPHGLNVRELAEHAGWNEEYTRGFLEAAFGLGLLELSSEAGVTPRSRYRLAPGVGDAFVDERTADFAGELPRLQLLAAADFKRLPDLFRTGKTYPYGLHGEAFLRSAAAATRSLPDALLRDVLPLLPDLRDRLEAGAHVLDVGCGAGWAIAAVAEAFPKCQVLGVDAEPNAIEMAKSWIVMRQLSARAEARLVRGEELDYEAEFNLATLLLVVHTIPPNQRMAALARVHRALKKAGRLLVVEEALPGSTDAYRDPGRRLTLLQRWMESTWGHRFVTPMELRGLLAAAGFHVEHEVAWGRHRVLVAAKA